MNILGPSPSKRLNEAMGFVFLFGALFLTLALISYHPEDESINTAISGINPNAGVPPSGNIVGAVGAYLADLTLQSFGMVAFLFPVLVLALAWHWLRSTPIETQWARVAGAVLLFLAGSTVMGLVPGWRLFDGRVPVGGLTGMLVSGWLVALVNLTGAILVSALFVVISLYLLTSFEVEHVGALLARPRSIADELRHRVREWIEAHRRPAEEDDRPAPEPALEKPAISRRRSEVGTSVYDGYDGIPIRTIDDREAAAEPVAAAPVEEAAAPEPEPEAAEPPVVEYVPPAPVDDPPWEVGATAEPTPPPAPAAKKRDYRLPATSLLNEPDERLACDRQELQDIAVRIKGKFEEFNVRGTVVQINPGPVVTTFEYKPEAGIKYSRMTTLTEDLCLGLQAESILIERIPGKPTVGIEVPNTKREVISLRQILESDEFRNSPSKMTIAMGKDISGRIKVAALESMPHLLIAGSTGSGKSVMLNSLIMSVLYKATPNDVRMILVDPKRVEMGVYEDIPHLLTPVITDPRKATNALRNAVLEMERRLKLLASQGVRNIDQYNRKVKLQMGKPMSLFEDPEEARGELEPLPYILIVIDELADLMMLERQGVEESITRLAQMARAVGMHLVVATQRPSVDVITGLIKANFPARVSFRVATRVDSRTILDVMGAEHLLGKGDMLFLPPGSSRLVRVHAPFVTESEIGDVTKSWREQARPEYDQSYLIAPPEEGSDTEDDLSDFSDPMYEDAVRVVCEVGKASTSTLQRRLRLGYGRAARILDKMFADGIIGPPDGSRPREVLRRPEWLDQPTGV
ncbi:MAG: DNA translocase FtsK 4TM domain-containing protein [Bryobacteraceae bacterium]